MITLSSVISSNIRRIGYDPEKQRLYIQFKSGATYRYSNVEPETYDTLAMADSIGGTFARLIKSNAERYPFLKLDLEPAAGEDDDEVNDDG